MTTTISVAATTSMYDSLTSVANWMEVQEEYLHDLKLEEIAIPGTHDSGCYQMSSRVGSPWTKCQRKTMAEQLELGIRYFDLRFGYYPRSKSEQFFVTHHSWGSHVKLSDVVDSVEQFMNQYPKEIVILQFSHFRKFNDQAHDTFKERILEKLGGWIVGRRAFSMNLGEMWQSDKRIVIVSEYDKCEEFCLGDSIASNWFNMANVKRLKVCCSEEITRPHDGPWILQAILSPKGHRFWSVKALARRVNPHILLWLQTWDQHRINIVIIDFCDSVEFTKAIMRINQRRFVRRMHSEPVIETTGTELGIKEADEK